MLGQCGRMTLVFVAQSDSAITFFSNYDSSSDYDEEYLYLLNPVPDRPRSVNIGSIKNEGEKSL